MWFYSKSSIIDSTTLINTNNMQRCVLLFKCKTVGDVAVWYHAGPQAARLIEHALVVIHPHLRGTVNTLMEWKFTLMLHALTMHQICSIQKRPINTHLGSSDCVVQEDPIEAATREWVWMLFTEHVPNTGTRHHLNRPSSVKSVIGLGHNIVMLTLYDINN